MIHSTWDLIDVEIPCFLTGGKYDMAQRPMTIISLRTAIGWWRISGHLYQRVDSVNIPNIKGTENINSYCYMQVIIFDTIQYQCVWFLSTKQYHFATNLLMMITADDGGESPHAFGTAAGISCARGISSPLTWVKGSGVLGRLVGWGWLRLRRPEMTRDSEPLLRTQAVSEKNHGLTLYRFRWFSHSNHHGIFQIMIGYLHLFTY